MILFHAVLALFLPSFISGTSQDYLNRTKTKRTLSDQIYTNGESKAVVFYMENPRTSEVPELQVAASSPNVRNVYSTPSKPLALVTVQQPIQVFEQDSPKQVAAQQVLYEFQQTPTNAESNVHVKQLFQPNIELTTRNPLYSNQQIEQLPTAQPLSSIHSPASVYTTNQNFPLSQPHAPGLASASSYNPTASNTVVSPVHHNLFTNHAQNSATFSYYNPLLPPSQQFQNTQISPKQIPGKYLYLNGRIIFHPNHLGQGHQGQTFPPNYLYNKGVYHNQQKLPLLNYGARYNRLNSPPGTLYGKPQNKLLTPNLPPITHNRFQAPKQLQSIDKPSSFPQKQEDTDEEDDKPVNEKNNNEGSEEEEAQGEEEGEENEGDEEENDFEDDNDSYTYESFPFEEDEYLDEEENYQFRSPGSRKNKERSKYHDEEHDNESEDDQDAKRASSKHNSKYPNSNRTRKYRMPPKYDSTENYAYGEKYSSNMKYQSPNYKNNGKKTKPQGKFKKIKYTKKPGSKPKIKMIEGRFSEPVPVTHKQKVYKERWYVTKESDGVKKRH